MAKKWTQEDDDFLRDKWGTMSISALGKHLNRSDNAIIVRKQRLHLGAFYDSGEYITLNQLCAALGSSSGYINTSWIENRAFPVKYKKMRSNKVKVVYLSDFWKWAEENRTFLDFSNFEENALGAEPDWVRKKRKEDILRNHKYKASPWTKREDDYLKGLLRQHRYSCAQLSEKLCRTEGAIQRRITTLGVIERPVSADKYNPWTTDQIDTLGLLIKQGHKYEEIHSYIPSKSTKAIRGYVFRCYLTENLDKVRQYIGDGAFGYNLPTRQLRHFRLMQGEERDEMKELLSQLAYLLNQRARNISPVSLAFKDYWQKDMCMNWSDIHGCEAGEKCCDSCVSFQRIQPQYCVRCGSAIYSRCKTSICDRCKVMRKKQAQKKHAILQARNQRRLALKANN